MIPNIVYYFSLTLTAIFGILLYVFLISCILPKVFLRPCKANAEPKSRGIKKYTFDGGRAIVYEPQLNVRKYFKQYILSENGGDKFVKCKLDERVTSTRYTVIAMDSGDKILDVIDVEETIFDKGYSRAVILPRKTSYINLIVKEINGAVVADRDKVFFSGWNVMLFTLCSAVMSAALSLITKTIVVRIISKMIEAVILLEEPGNLLTLAIGVSIGVLYSVIICASHISRESKIKFGKSRHSFSGNG